MKKLFTLFGLVAVLSGCAGTDKEIEADKPLKEIYETAYAEFND